jgi:hypothetical protein
MLDKTFDNYNRLQNSIPPCLLYGRFLEIAEEKLNITKDEARNKYGLYTVAGRQFFITSEDNFNRTKKAYTIREAMPDGDIQTVGEFLGYESKEQAIFNIPFQMEVKS